MRADSAAFAQKNVELAKDPRYVIELAFDSANTQLWYLTSHSDAALPPAGVSGSILGVVQGLSGTSQTLNPDTANASIGNISFSLVDKASIVTTTLGGQLVLGRSTRKQRVRIYVGYQGLAWADYTLVQTQLVTEVAFADGAYKFTCADIQREMRKDLFDPAKTTLALSLDESATTVDVYTTTGFSTVAHGTSYSDAPSATVGYIRIQDEVIRYTGTTSTQFTGCTRGALNTRAAAHAVDATTAAERHQAVTEYVYLELPAIDLMYRLLTGKDRLGASVMPSTWNLGIATSYARLADFTGVGKDLWDTADDQQGFVVRLEDLAKTDGKKFIETELALLCGVFMPIYADGAVGVRRMANILAGAAYVRLLDETNVVSYGDLAHDFGALHNVIQIGWNWEPLQKDFTRVNALVDAASIATHGRADPLNLKFRGLHGSRHSSAIIAQRFDALRDRYSAPPLRLDVSVVPSLNTLEVGDVVRVRLANVRDFTAPGGGAPIDRSFEIQNIQTDWITGALKLRLFASSQAPGAVAPTSDASVLTSAWRTGTGTALASVLTITGSNPGHVSANGSLAGNADMNAAGAIYYYDGDLQIDAGVTVTIANNVQLRTKFFQNNGKINGKGGGLAGAAAVGAPATNTDCNPGTAGFIGTTEAGGGFLVDTSTGFALPTITSYRGAIVVGKNPVVPGFQLKWDGTTLGGIPGDLRGSSGSSGMPFTNGPGLGRYAGGAGGNGGAGLAIACDGFAQGAAGSIDLSGADGVAPAAVVINGQRFYPGSGAGGAPGGLLLMLNGAAVTATGLTDAGFVALNGKTAEQPGQLESPGMLFGATLGRTDFSSYFAGSGDGSGIPLPSLSDSRGGARVQYVPGNPLATVDLPQIDALTIAIEETISANWLARSNPSNLTLLSVAWSPSLGLFCAVGDVGAPGPRSYVLTSPDGIQWTARAPAKNLVLWGIEWSPTLALFCAVGNADTDAYIITSPDGIAWTERANPQAVGLNGVGWGGGKFVAVGSAAALGQAYIVTRPDGITWTQRTNPVAQNLRKAAWSGAQWLAIGDAGYVVTSPDGITWTQRTGTPIGTNTFQDAVWYFPPHFTAGLWVVVGDAIITSPDGITWTTRMAATAFLKGVTTTGTILVAAGSFTGAVSSLFTSHDTVVWTPRENPQTTGLNKIAWSGKRFVAVGNADGTKAYLITSLSK